MTVEMSPRRTNDTSMKMADKQEPFAPQVKVLGKVARILNHLQQCPDLTVPELAAILGEPRPTVYRLIQDLASLGYVEQGPKHGGYRLGLELFRLGSSVALRFDVREAASEAMGELHRKLEETVYLTIRRGFDAVCIESLEGLHIRSMALQLGGSLPLHLGAGPRVLLAFEPEEQWEEYLAEAKLEPMTPASPTSRDEVLKLLKETREAGYAISDEDVTIGIASVGAPIFDHTGAIRAAISVGGLRSKILEASEERTVALVLEAAARISERLGHSG